MANIIGIQVDANDPKAQSKLQTAIKGRDLNQVEYILKNSQYHLYCVVQLFSQTNQNTGY